MKRLEGFVIGLIVAGILMFAVPVMAQNSQVLFNVVKIAINGQPVNIESISCNGFTYLKVKDLCDAVGKEVEWDGNTKTVNILNPPTIQREIKTITYNNGDTYSGTVKNGIPEGEGTYTFKNGDKYIGSFKNGVFHGIGDYYWANGGMFHGEYQNGMLNGGGIEIKKDKSSFAGFYINGKLSGPGILLGSDGSMVLGIWQDGKQIGDSIVTLADGTKGYFYNGELVQVINLNRSSSNNSTNTIKIPAVTSTPTHTVDNTKAYEAELAALTATYNQDISKMETEIREANNTLYSEWLDKYGLVKDSITAQVAYNAMMDKIEANNKKLEQYKETRKAQYEADVVKLKQKYGM